MSDDVRVACPHCGSRFRLKSRQSLDKKITCRNCSDEFTARESAEDDEFAAPAVLPPAPSRRSAGSRRRKKSGSFRVNRWVVVAVALVAVAGLGLVFSHPLSRFLADITEMGGSFNPLVDSPEKAMNDLRALRREIGSTARSVRDEGSRDAAIRKYKAMQTTAADLVARASRLDSLTEQEVQALMEPFIKESAEEFIANAFRRDGQSVVVQIDARLATPELKTAMLETESMFSEALASLRDGLKALPQPQTDGEQVEHDAAEQFRRVVRCLARISSAGARDAAASEVAGAAATMKELARRAAEVPPEQVSRINPDDFHKPEHQAWKQCNVLMRALEDRYGKHTGLEEAIIQFHQENKNIGKAFGPARSAALEKEFRDKAEKKHAEFLRSAGLAGQPGTAPAAPPAGAAGGFVTLPSSPQAMRDDFLKRHGPDGVLTVKSKGYPADKLGELSKLMREVTGADQTFAFADIDGTTYVYVAHAGDVDEVAARIDFCKVVAVEGKKRTITIEPRPAGSRAKKQGG